MDWIPAAPTHARSAHGHVHLRCASRWAVSLASVRPFPSDLPPQPQPQPQQQPPPAEDACGEVFPVEERRPW
ncbi:hypothetical protein GUJ93_ZPchr0005g15223 [Zizania palustris]|uniref:Uncharacterized protein n=1 Tax=Zizania palustris TaxID=103762 RepID=A0A8J5VR90_ZIZPA|nr:hypothetical protein GUJ93_ZPchr0005g16319 [Zizania palustris]KAG8068401.1 hypothetical protein GUJ93_ZPchr0005g16319 [Zizania palustris]KAG8068408.1 hypothetical protein GUJ93_ZPchr0005g15223 [Zizania palustris]